MKKYFNRGLIIAALLTLQLTSCEDDRALVSEADFFEVEAADYLKLISDTIVVNVNEKLTFKFSNGNTDQILFYPGESGKEFRFAKRALFTAENGNTLESKITVATTVSNYANTQPSDYSLHVLQGMTTCTVEEILASTKTELVKLRATATSGSQVNENYILNATSTPLNIFAGDLNIALIAKSADATKNMLAVSAAGLVLTSTETRNYGYSKNGVVVTNLKTVAYPLITNVVNSAAWGQYAPAKTIAPGSTVETDNAVGYSWNVGETGVSFAPAITGGVMLTNSNGIIPTQTYPVSVTVPADAAKVVAEGSAPSEAWLVSRGVNPCTVKPDVATIIKRVDQSSVLNYQYIYKERGIYKASVVGLNLGNDGTRKVVREFVILVKNPADNF